MTTRRKFGLGIAAIIAAQRAPASLVRSIVAGRQTGAMKKEEVPPTPQGLPYITPTNAKQGIIVDALALTGSTYVADFTMVSPLAPNPDYCSVFGARNYDENYEFGLGVSLFGIFRGQNIVTVSRQGYSEEESTGINVHAGNRYRITFAPSLVTIENVTLQTTSQYQYQAADMGTGNGLMIFSVADYDPYDTEVVFPDFNNQFANNPSMPMKLHRFQVFDSQNVLTHDYEPYSSGGVVGLRNTLNGNIFTNATEWGGIGDFAYGVE